jgi:hypothetical protein
LRGILALILLAGLLVPAGAVAAAPPTNAEDEDDTLEVGTDYNGGKPLPFENGIASQASEAAQSSARATPQASGSGAAAAADAQAAQAESATVGAEQAWLALDDVEGSIYLKDYTLRGLGEHIEVWVASDEDEVSTGIQFPEGDCRNGARTEITDEQVAYLVEEFDGNIYPKESETFSVPPARDGTGALLPELVEGLPADYFAGDGDNIVVLVDNVRDENFYDEDNQQGLTYIAGFFYSVFNEYVDRNVMTIDAYDWLHRTRENPPNEPSEDLCTNAPARPFLYEGVFAHEYQHLLHYYTDPGETTWVNEGLSDYAQTLTGYVDTTKPITDLGYDSHIQCFLGYLGVRTEANPIPREQCGPENSLTNWQDQGPAEILADYGAAYSMTLFLADRYGEDFLTGLHLDEANGLESLQDQLDTFAPGTQALDVLHDWAAMTALDGVLDDNGGLLLGASLGGGNGPGFRRLEAGDYRTSTLDSTIRWDTPEAYSTPGAPPNGSDYVRLRDGNGEYLSLGQLRSLSFDGAETLPPQPVEWTVDENPAGHEGDAALSTGVASNLDAAIIRPVTVPADNPTLTFDTSFDTEEGWDFGFVQVSTDGGQTYTSLANELTTDEAVAGAVPTVQENLPGFTGSSGGWVSTSFDLSAYAGQEVLLSFRYVTDTNTEGPGWWVDNVTVGGELVSDGSTLEGWSSATEIRPVPVDGFTLQLVAYASDGSRRPALLTRFELDGNFDVALGSLRPAITRLGRGYDVVGAIVTYDEPTESITQYAPYTLVANGVVQPGGS